MPSLSFLAYRLAKGWQVAPALLSRPTRIPLLFRGVSPGRLIALDVPWLKEGNIKTVIDIGANIGQFAQAIHYLLPGATIHSFEPLADCYHAMLNRMAGVSSFHAYSVALGEETADVEFNRNEFSQSSSVLPMARLHREAFSWSARSTRTDVTGSTAA